MVVCAVLPSFNRVAAIPEEATFSAIFPDCLNFVNIKLAMNVFLVSSGAPKKKTYLCYFQRYRLLCHMLAFDL